MIYDQCVDEFDLNRWQAAKDCFEKLPEGSRLAKKARYKLAECNKQLSSRHRVEGRRGEADSEGAIKAKYPDPQLALAVLRYYQGRTQPAMQELQKLAAMSRDRGLADKALELLGTMRLVYGKYNEGLSLMHRTQTVEAKAAFDLALLADAALMPEGAMSFYREDISKQLGLQLYKEGQEHCNRKSFLDAFRSWSDCLQRSPSETACANGLLQLEQAAEDAFEEVGRLEAAEDWREAGAKLMFIQSITRPESKAWKRAEKRLREYEQSMRPRP
ncbi:MAG TPA: hypothetical protein PK668_02155 [Myxococcota bacterium]|nr:hypothetical protein [Myxococcota bacterium]HRY94628.1 hypothetical protein [Myxococcota bacterium]HSA21487.1 hypothetical protein [Myxococcota bacterium]